MPRLLTDMPDESLWAGDIIRLAHDYDLGPGSAPVDLMVYDPRDDDAGLGVIVVSGLKSGLTLSIFPKASSAAGKRSLETAWLLGHWNDWFCYTYVEDRGRLLPLPIAGTLVIGRDEREISIKNNADSRPA